MDMVLYALLKKKINGVASGVASHLVVGNDLILTFNDGSQATISFKQPKDGASIIDVKFNDDNELITTLSNGQIINAGKIITSGDEVSLENYYTKKETEQLIELLVEQQLNELIEIPTDDDIKNLF